MILLRLREDAVLLGQRKLRATEAYQYLADSSFGTVEAQIRHDLFRMRYTLIVLECGA